MPHLLVLRGPAGAGKSTLARSLEHVPPDGFEVVSSDELPPPDGYPQPPKSLEEWIERRMAQISMWGSKVADHVQSERNILLDCDLQLPWEILVLERTAGVKLGTSDALVVRLGVSVETAKRRKTSLAPERVEELHRGWSAPPLECELRVDTEGKDSNTVRGVVLRLLRERWQ